MKVAIAQIRSTPDIWENLGQLKKMIDEATAQKCDLVCFPENALYRGPKRTDTVNRESSYLHLEEAADRLDRERSARRPSRLVPHSKFSEDLAKLFSELKITLSLGSVFQSDNGRSKPYNSHWIVRPGGEIVPYHKIHLFNFDSPAGTYRESDEIHPGDHPQVVDIGGWKVGLSICYDLRFPELYRQLAIEQGAEILLIPAAFTRVTGEVHWHTLLKARAIENLCFVCAPGQWGAHTDARGQELFCYGHSLAVGPWGDILAEAPADGNTLLTIELDRAELKRRREQLPALESVRLIRR